MTIQKISIHTTRGVKTYACKLKNKNQFIYQIVDSDGNQLPQYLEWEHNGHKNIFLFNGIKIVGDDVFTFTILTEESYKLGKLLTNTI